MTKRPKPKTYHHGDLREALIVSGTKIIESKGLTGFTLRECARRAGVSHAAPRNHFTSVEDLVLAIAARGWEKFHAAIALAADKVEEDAGARLAAMGKAYVEFAVQQPGIYSLMFRTGDLEAARLASAGSNELAALGQKSSAAWHQLVEAVEAVTGPSRQVELAALHVWSLVHGYASLSIDRKFRDESGRDRALAASLAALAPTVKAIAGGGGAPA